MTLDDALDLLRNWQDNMSCQVLMLLPSYSPRSTSRWQSRKGFLHNKVTHVIFLSEGHSYDPFADLNVLYAPIAYSDEPSILPVAFCCEDHYIRYSREWRVSRGDELGMPLLALTFDVEPGYSMVSVRTNSYAIWEPLVMIRV
jgi:hypothetical protein